MRYSIFWPCRNEIKVRFCLEVIDFTYYRSNEKRQSADAEKPALYLALCKWSLLSDRPPCAKDKTEAQ